MNLKPLIVQAQVEPVGVVIWLHGLGADQHDLVPVCQQLTGLRTMRHIFVQAPTMPITIHQGQKLPAWFDLHPDDMNTLGVMRDQSNIDHSLADVADLIQSLCAEGWKSQQILLIGFSQGGSMALSVLLACQQPLGGAACLSGWLLRNPLTSFDPSRTGQPTFSDHSGGHKHRSSVLLHHGKDDEVVPFQSALISRVRLQALACRVHWHAFDGGHCIVPEQLPLIERFIIDSIAV